MAEEVIFSRENHLGLITLNRTSALNALTLPMILAMQEQLQAWKEDNAIHAVVVRSNTDKVFCAGGDIRWLYEAGRQQNPQQMQFFWHEYRLNYFIHHYNKPYIALMNGLTMGGGVGISMHGSHPVGTEQFVFAMPETGIGFFPDIGASYLLSRCPGKLGIYLGLTGSRLNAVDAYALGLIKFVMPEARLDDVFERLLAMDLSENAAQQVDDCLQNLAISPPKSPLIAQQQFIDEMFSSGEMEVILATLKNSEEVWAGDIWASLMSKAPLSLKITLAQIINAKQMALADCLKMDYCLVGHFMQDHDFYEGVRALLIDKDKTPHWQPKILPKVSTEKVAKYFKCDAEELSLWFASAESQEKATVR